MARPMTDDDLISAIESEEAAAYGLLTSDLADERAAAMDRYLSRPYGDEIPGRSQIVSSDVADAIEWIMPSLLKVFLAGDEIVRFDPKGPDDEEQAKQETDYINDLVTSKNNAFVVLNSWFKDALLQKVGYVKVRWHKSSDTMIEHYQGMAPEEIDALLHDPAVQVIGQRSYPDPAAPQPDPQMMAQMFAAGQEPPPLPVLYDVKIRRRLPREWARYDPVPPEEMLISVKARTVSLQECPFVQHRTRKTISELRQMGLTIPDDIEDDSGGLESNEAQARDRYGEQTMRQETNADPASREVSYRESWIRIDYDGDGVAELRFVSMVGHTIFMNEEAEVVPFPALTPIIMSHRHVGLSYYDLIHDIAKIKTALIRNLLDNLYLQNNGRTAIDSNTVTLEDLLVSRPGGVVRVDGPPGMSMMPIVTPDMSGAALAGLSYMDDLKENRTGVTKYSQGLDPDALVKTATQSSQLLTQALLRVEMIARTFAETGVKELFQLVHHFTLRHGQKADKIKLRGKWVLVDPREWVDRHNLTVGVGLGTGNKDQMLMHLQMMLGLQKEAVQFGLTDMSKIRNTLGKISQNAGFRNAEEFWNDPGPQAPNPPPPPEVQAAQITAQAQMQLTQMQSQTKHGADMQIAAAQAETQKQLEMLRAQSAAQLKDMDNQCKLVIAEMQEETKRMVAANQVNLRLSQNVPDPRLQA